MDKNSYRKANSVPKRFLRKSLKIILFLGIPFILFGFTFQLKNVSVMGTTRYTPEEIREKFLRSSLDTNTLIFYLKYQYFTDVKIPFIEKIDLEMKGKNTIDIRLYEKKVTGCVEFMGEYLYFDKDGIVVESSPDRLADIPLIKGLRFDKIILNEKLEVQKNELFDVILNLTQMIEKYTLEAQTITFNQDCEVTLDCGDIVALLGKRSTYDEVLSELKSMLADEDGEIKDILDEQEGDILELDMRKFTKGTDTINGKLKKSTD